MSVQAMSWALSQQIVTEQAARHVLLCLANYADRDGRGAFPSVQALMADTGLSERSVRYKLDALQEAGAIKAGDPAIVAAYIKRGDKRPACYDIAMGAESVKHGVQMTTERGAPVAPHESRGANDDSTGCKPQQLGVQMTTERGAPVAPNPSINHQLSVIEPINTPPTPDGGSGVQAVEPDGFPEFWSVYPLKTGKKAAMKAWAALKPSADLRQTMLVGLRTWCRHDRWTKEGGKYRHHASTWLNQRFWEDEEVCGSTSAGVSGTAAWFELAGFPNRFEAENAGCYAHNANKFRDGQRLPVDREVMA